MGPSPPKPPPKYDVHVIRPAEWSGDMPLNAILHWGIHFFLPPGTPDSNVYNNAPDGVWRGFHQGREGLTVEEQKRLFAANSRYAGTLLGHAYNFAVHEYTRGGTLKLGDLPEEIRKDLENIRDGSRAVVLITEEDNPKNILQMVSVAYTGKLGVPLEARLVHRKKIEALDQIIIASREFEDFEFLDIGRTAFPAEIASLFWGKDAEAKRKWPSGARAELKALIKKKASRMDFIPLIHQLLITHGLNRWGFDPVPDGMIPQILKEKEFIRWVAINQHMIERRAAEAGHHPKLTILDYLLGPLVSKYLRVTELVIEAMDDPELNYLLNMYTQNYGFRQIRHRDRDPDLPHLNLNVLSHTSDGFEHGTRAYLLTRPGGKLVQTGLLEMKYVPGLYEGAPSIHVEQWPHDRAEVRRYLSEVKQSPIWEAVRSEADRIYNKPQDCTHVVHSAVYGHPWTTSLLDLWNIDPRGLMNP